jgi:nitronate monooxygenase
MFLCSGPELVVEQCKAGVIGSFPALNARPQEDLTRWLTQIESELARFARAYPQAKVGPFAVSIASIAKPSDSCAASDLSSAADA